MFTAWCCNTAWMASGRLELAAFHRDLRHCATVQQRVLAKMLNDNRDTDFGRRYDFAGVRSPLDFQRRVPAAAFEDFRSYIDRIAAGESNVLTAEPVTCLHPTGGTSGGEKLIPYTRTLRRQFQRALRVWIADLFAGCPAARNGRAYWSLSPALGPRRLTSGGIAIGFDDDTEYLGLVARWAAERLLVVPDALAKVDDLAQFRYLTVRHLVAAEDLALVSVWSPTFFSGLLRDLNAWRERLADDLPNDRLRSILRSGPLGPDELRGIWPKLALVSCWADGASAGPYAELCAMLPHASFQPKGLLATEGFTSIPLWNQPAPALAVRSHFFEFLEEGADPAATRPRLAHELDVGGRYEVLLTTAGGLYRYRTGDGITAVGRLHACPLVRFVGRFDGTSDLVGEKLSSAQVAAVLETLWRSVGVQPIFALLAPGDERPSRYRLYVQDGRVTVARLKEMARLLEQGLAANPYYRQAVGLGQLAVAEVAWLDPDGPAAWDLYCRWYVDAGRRWGDVKPVVLDRATHWEPTFAPLVRSRATADDTPA